MRKNFFITADDFGISKPVNEAIVNLLLKKKIDYATLIVNLNGFEDAVDKIKKYSLENKIGFHFNLTWGKPVSENLKKIVDKNGYFLNLKKLYFASLFKNIKDEVEKELKAQIKKFENSGLKLNFMTGHQYIELFPQIGEIYFKFAIKNKIKVRFPLEKSKTNLKKGIRKLLFNLHLLRFKNKVLKNELNMSKIFFGSLHAGEIEKDLIKTWLENSIYPKEILVHPGFPSENKFEKINKKKEKEYKILLEMEF